MEMEKKVINVDVIKQALESGLNTNVNMYFIPSLNKRVGFKPLLTAQCKTLAKMLIDANDKPFDTFNITVGLIKASCMDTTIDINLLTELDRLTILMNFYRSNNILKDFDVECPSCKKQTKIIIDMDKIIADIESSECDDIIFSNEQENKLVATISVPNMVVMYQFYELVQKGEAEFDDLMNCFIKDFVLTFDNTDIDNIDISTDDTELKECFKVMDMIPYNVWTNSTDLTSIFDIILNKLNEMMSTSDVNQICTHCGTNLEEVATARNFI